MRMLLGPWGPFSDNLLSETEGFSVKVSGPPLARKASSLIGIETFGTRFRNRPLLGFEFRNNTGKR